MKIIYRDPNITVFQSAIFQTNSTVVLTDDMILVVDPAWLPEEVLEIRRFVDDHRAGRPLWLMLTHSDFDHVLGYGLFRDAGLICSRNLIQNPQKEAILEQIRQWDDDHYVIRNYPLDWPEKADFEIWRDGAIFKLGATRISFHTAPGHTADGIIGIVWHLGTAIVGDYLSDLEFPFIYHSSVEYEKTLEKIPRIHDKTWFVKVIPGHGSPGLTIQDWLARRTDSLEYIHDLRRAVRKNEPFDEAALFEKYRFRRLQKKYHDANLELVKKEYAELGDALFQPKRGPNGVVRDVFE